MEDQESLRKFLHLLLNRTAHQAAQLRVLRAHYLEFVIRNAPDEAAHAEALNALGAGLPPDQVARAQEQFLEEFRRDFKALDIGGDTTLNGLLL